MNIHKSNFIFTLADAYGIHYKTSQSHTIDDESYFSFCDEYLKQCKTRDVELRNHLIVKLNLFRTFVPWREGVLSTVLELQWYYDELLVYDPIYFELTYFKDENIQKKKQRIQQILYYLHFLKDSISEGFLLFASYDSISKEVSMQEGNFDKLLFQPEIRKECDKLVQVYKMQGPGELNKGYYNVRSHFRGKQTLFSVIKDPEKIKNEFGYALSFDLIGSQYTPMNIEEIKNEEIYDKVFNNYVEEYQNEIRFILRDIETGNNIHTPILFDRRLDELILKEVSNETAVSDIANDYYKLFLPFVDGIPPEKLFDLRMKMPSAFIDFRGAMFEIIYDAGKENLNYSVLKLKIERKVNPIVKSLDVEIKNALTTSRIMGGGALVSGIGTLGLWHYGIDPAKFESILTEGIGVLSGLGGLAKHISNKRAFRSNDFFYLWKAQKYKSEY